MEDFDVDRLRRTRRIPVATQVACRAPGDEMSPTPRAGEVVVFGAHFDRGFGLPVSAFFRSFLDFFGLQPHHLPANAILVLSSFATCCEAYLGVWPSVDLWSRLFFLKPQMADAAMSACGAASIYNRPGSSFPKVPTVESAKKWQTSFFYVKNVDPAVDFINLPAFTNSAPTAKLHWGYDPKKSKAEVNSIVARLHHLVQSEHLAASDLLITFVSRRVLPLQLRAHKIGHMSGRLDPTRTSAVELEPADVARRVNLISNAKLPEKWRWGMKPFDRANRPPVVSGPALRCFRTSCFPSFILLTFIFLSGSGCRCFLARTRRMDWSRTGSFRLIARSRLPAATSKPERTPRLPRERRRRPQPMLMVSPCPPVL